MPLFRRPDGDLVTDETPVRTIMPYIMRGRNESAVYHEDKYDITKARAWLRAYNQNREGSPVGLFHLIFWSVGQGMHERSYINRFISGRSLYQRKNGVYLSFAAKREMREDAPLIALKLHFPHNQPFEETVRRIDELVMGGRSGEQRPVDKELALFMKVPGFLRDPIMRFLQWLDRINLAPGFMIENDPLYTSAFIANLGSVGLDNSFHHLYEVGTCSLFIVMGTAHRENVLDRHGKLLSRDVIQMRYTLDERVADGFYAGASLRWFKRVIEDPEKYLGPPNALKLPSQLQSQTQGDAGATTPSAAASDAPETRAAAPGLPPPNPPPSNRRDTASSPQ